MLLHTEHFLSLEEFSTCEKSTPSPAATDGCVAWVSLAVRGTCLQQQCCHLMLVEQLRQQQQ